MTANQHETRWYTPTPCKLIAGLLVVAVCLFGAGGVSFGAERAVGLGLPWVRAAEDGRAFVLEEAGRKFVPWGFNYDHDETGRLIEDYWDNEWPKVEEDFREMKKLGANVVRVHLQFGKFMQAADKPNPKALERLGKLLRLAEHYGLYLDLTGLGCYHKKDVPAWYDRLDEPQRWAAQARFWEAVAERCAGSPAVFCYDLMNEPVVPGGDKKQENWLGPAFAGKHFVQFITREARGRPRHEIARRWIGQLAVAIRKHDRRHLITVGLVPWSLDRPGLTSGFVPEKVAGEKLVAELPVGQQTPPAFFAHAGDDKHAAEGSIRYYLALRCHNIPGELHVYPKGGHGFGLRPSEHPVSTWPKRCEEWMNSMGLLQK